MMPSLQDATSSHFNTTLIVMGEGTDDDTIYYAIHVISLLKMINFDINYMNLRL